MLLLFNSASSNKNKSTTTTTTTLLSIGLVISFVLFVFSSCNMMSGVYSASTSSCYTTNNTYNTTTTPTSVQAHLEVIDREISELTILQQRLNNTLTLLQMNATLNSEIIVIRSKQIAKITKALVLLTQESSYLKVRHIVRNGQQIWEYNDGTRAKSCKEYRNSTMYSTQGSGLYNIDPNTGTNMTVYCDMTTDGGGWTLISGIRNDYAGVHFHTFEDSTAVDSSSFTSFHLKTTALLSISTQVRAAADTAATAITTFYLSTWTNSAYCTITPALRQAILNPTINNGDLPNSCTILSGTFTKPTHFTYGKTGNGESTGFRMGVPFLGVTGLYSGGGYSTFSYSGAPEGGNGNSVGVSGVESRRNGVIFLR